jgi:lipid II:glycine glycyltransferase (peptidoglycan interpeptide bridge formation enzyme)
MHGTVYPYWGGGTFEARRMLGSDAMYFELMRHARDSKGCTRYDFGRSKVDSGNATFKANWGFEPQALTYARRLAPGAVARVINPTNPKYRLQVAAWKKLPLWAANIVGPPISRGLG